MSDYLSLGQNPLTYTTPSATSFDLSNMSKWGPNAGTPNMNYGYGGGNVMDQFLPQTSPMAGFDIGTNSASVASGLGASGGNWWDGMIGSTGAPGWGGLALGAIQGIGSAFMGAKQFGLAKDALKQSKQQFALNYGAQKTTTNNQIDGVNTARAASREGAATNPYTPMKRIA